MSIKYITHLSPASSLCLKWQLRSLRGSLTTDNIDYKSKVFMSMNKNGFSKNKSAQRILYNKVVNFSNYYDFQKSFIFEPGKNLYCSSGFGYDICFTSDFVLKHWDNTKEAMKEIRLILDAIIKKFDDGEQVNELNDILGYIINFNDCGVISIK